MEKEQNTVGFMSSFRAVEPGGFAAGARGNYKQAWAISLFHREKCNFECI